MRGFWLLASAVACVLAVFGWGAAAGRAQSDEGISVEAGDGTVDLGVWIEVDVPGVSETETRPVDLPTPPCHFRQGNYAELTAWLMNDYVVATDPYETYIFKLCDTGGGYELSAYWVHRPSPPAKPQPATVSDTTRLRDEAWGRLTIPEPITVTAPGEVAVVQLPTYVWVPDAARNPVSETVLTNVDGHELSLTATASPRRLGFLQVDMGDGNTLWCDAADVVAFDPARDPLEQPSDCFHYYRFSSVDQPDLRYRVVVTAYWDVSVKCRFNGGPCANPPPAIGTQVLTAPPRPLAVAEIQALGSFG